MFDLDGKAVVILKLGLQLLKDVIGDRDLLTTLLADQVMVMISATTVFVASSAITDADRRDKANHLEPLQATVDGRDVDVGLLRHNRRVNLFSGQVPGV